MQYRRAAIAADFPKLQRGADKPRAGQRRPLIGGQIHKSQLDIALKPVGQTDIAVGCRDGLPSIRPAGQYLHRRISRVSPGGGFVFIAKQREVKQAVPIAGPPLGKPDIEHDPFQPVHLGIGG